MQVRECCNFLHHHFNGRRRHTDVQSRASTDLYDLTPCDICHHQQTSGTHIKRFSSLCQRNISRAACKKLYLQLLLEKLHLIAERRLRHMQVPCRCTDRACIYDCAEVFKLFYLHIPFPHRFRLLVSSIGFVYWFHLSVSSIGFIYRFHLSVSSIDFICQPHLLISSVNFIRLLLLFSQASSANIHRAHRYHSECTKLSYASSLSIFILYEYEIISIFFIWNKVCYTAMET